MGRRNKRMKTEKINISKVILVTSIIVLGICLAFFLLWKVGHVDSKNPVEKLPETAINQNEEKTPQKEEEKKPKKEEITFNMLTTGDIMCHNTMYNDAYIKAENTYDFSYMFEDVKYYIQTADIAIGNLETTFAGKDRGYSNYPTFNTPEQLATTLKKVGFDVVSTANNHSLDKGYSGLVSTINYLDEADVSHTGTFATEEDSQKILIKNVKGAKVAFLSYTYGTNGIPVPKDKTFCINLIDKNLILKQLEMAKAENPDVICVSMHWGVEYQTKPNAEQKELADFLFNNGVDIILGNHPHVPQSMEKRTITLEDGTTKEGFVIYSLGNLMADQNKQYTRDSALLNINVTVTKEGENKKVSINSATYTPIYYYKNPSVSLHKFKMLDIENVIKAYESGADQSIGKNMYNTLKTELTNIQKIIGDEITEQKQEENIN